MPSISLENYAAWSNYHLTVGESPEEGLPPAMTIEHLRRTHCGDVDQTDPLGTMGATAGMLMRALKETEQDTESRFGEREPNTLAAGIVGRGWSFTSLIGTPFSQIMSEGLAWVAKLDETDLHSESKNVPLCLCGGGTRLREVVSWAERQDPPLSIATSGTHLGPTVAGAFGTASHGSRLDFGGFQNLVRGMHIVTAENRHVWLHKEESRVLNDAALKKLRAEYDYTIPGDLSTGTPPKPIIPRPSFACVEILEVEDFENALIHLGCMGIVNAVALELVPAENLAVMGWKAPLPVHWLDWISKGDFQQLANHFGADGLKPEFYELTIDPFKPMSEPAAHLFYFKDDARPKGMKSSGGRLTPADVISSAAGQTLSELKNFPEADFWPDTKGLEEINDGSQSAAIEQILRTLLQDQPSVIQAYLMAGGFIEPKPQFSLEDAIKSGSWGDIHEDEVTGGKPGALYNASYAIDRRDVPMAVPVISAAVQKLSSSFVFTLRFVDKPAGNLAFTRFENNAVIEIDGLSPFICKQMLRYLQERREPDVFARSALEVLASTVERGAIAVKHALSQAGIEYSMHWAKLGDLNEAKVTEDFGPRGKKPAIESWRETRMKLVTSTSDKFFRNPAALNYGLLEPIGPAPRPTSQCNEKP